ncbi:MAG: hypothetical protein Q9227_005194 [Pyrenula ochraceoflavens]
MQSQYLDPAAAAAMTEHRKEAIRLAKRQEEAVRKKAEASGTNVPPYEMLELIGKGSYGRVYKAANTNKEIVAVKVIDIDDADFRAFGEAKEEQIKDFQKEIKILREADESGAPNLNRIIDAFSVHSQLWLICEYCPGGSVKTLMRATNNRLGERYIAIVARELAKALQALHKAGIMHRDVKAANVLIHEEGQLQLCDFGVATVFDPKGDKRKTFIGTVHWMPPEMFAQEPQYAGEVDVWGFGCTLYECATGNPPNADLREPRQLGARLRRANKALELPADQDFPNDFRDLVSYTLTPDQSERPDMSKVLEHEYIVNNEEIHPTSSLVELVQVYYAWLFGGGQRASLFIQAGARDVSVPGTITDPDDSDAWNFSTTDIFEKRISTVLNIPDLSRLEESPSPDQKGKASLPLEQVSLNQKANFEERVKRGADLANIFDQNKPNYTYQAKNDFVPVEERRVSDLPFRNTMMPDDRPYSIASNVLDLGDFDSSNYASVPDVRLADAATIRASRAASKFYREASSSSEALTARRTSSAHSDDPYFTASDTERPRPPTMGFSFPPKEWMSEPNSPPAGATAPPAPLAAKPKAKETRKTMEWSFAAAMTEASASDADAEPDTDTEAKPSSSNTLVVPPPPLLRTITQPVTASEARDLADTHPLMSSGASISGSEAETEGDPFGLDRHGDVDGGPTDISSDENSSNGPVIVSMPKIKPPSSPILAPGVEDRLVEVELEKMLSAFGGVLSGVGEALKEGS